MAKSMLFQAALLLLFIARGHSQAPVTPPITPNELPLCAAAIAKCKADTTCAPFYAAFEKNCEQERAGTPANCTQECLVSMYALLGNPLGLATLLCDCGTGPIGAAACRASHDKLQANCFPAPPPGAPIMCGRSCLEAQGRCFQNLTCASVVTSIPSKCIDIIAWNGEGDLPACCSDCRDTLNKLYKLPNAMELECCDCGGDMGCEMFQMKISAACPSRINCKRDCPQKPPVCPRRGGSTGRNCSYYYMNCPRCRQLIEEQANACRSVFAWDGQGDPPMCPEECAAANKAFKTLPNAKELACCDCGEGPFGKECNMRKMKIEATCGFGNIECDDTTNKTCPLDHDRDEDSDEVHDDKDYDNRRRPVMCHDFFERCPPLMQLLTKISTECKSVLDWNGQGNPPMCPEACMNITRAMKALPNARRLACCDCGEGPQGMHCKMTKMKLGAACGYNFDCNMRPPMCPREPRPPRRQSCQTVVMNCPRCHPLFERQKNACRSVFEWDGQGNPPMCTEECAAANEAFAVLPNIKELACCDCGEGAHGRECRMYRKKFEAACGKSDIECDGTTDKTCPLDRDDDGEDDDDRQRPVMCRDILERCPKHMQLISKELVACKSVLDWNGQGDPPMCPEACMNITRAVEALPNARRLACCDCGEGPQGMHCKMTKMKLGAACGHGSPPMCPREPRPPHRQSCQSVVMKCPRCYQLIERQINACRSVFEWNGQGNPPVCTKECMAAHEAFAVLPNIKELACCDCGEGAHGRECRMNRMKFEAACGKSDIECDDTTNKTCPLDHDDEDDDNLQRPLMCHDILERCPKLMKLVVKQFSACKSVLDWNGQGIPPMCPKACMNISRALGALPNARRLACCDCGEGPQGMHCKMVKMKLGAACDYGMSPMCPREPRQPRRQSCQSVVMNCPRCHQLIEKQINACRSVMEWNGQGNPPMCTEECVAALTAFTVLPNFKELACCDCGEGPFGRECSMNRMKFEAACGKSPIECDDTNEMCPSRPRPRGVVDCYTLEGICARNSTCAPLVLDILECVTDTGFQTTPDCQNARMRIHDFLMRHGMSMNCTCITSPVQCGKFRAAMGMPEEEPPSCKAARKQCSDDVTCSAIFEAWKTACADLKGKAVKKCAARCTATGSMLRQNILGSRVWQCLKGDNKTLKTKFMKLCLY